MWQRIPHSSVELRLRLHDVVPQPIHEPAQYSTPETSRIASNVSGTATQRLPQKYSGISLVKTTVRVAAKECVNTASAVAVCADGCEHLVHHCSDLPRHTRAVCHDERIALEARGRLPCSCAKATHIRSRSSVSSNNSTHPQRIQRPSESPKTATRAQLGTAQAGLSHTFARAHKCWAVTATDTKITQSSDREPHSVNILTSPLSRNHAFSGVRTMLKSLIRSHARLLRLTQDSSGRPKITPRSRTCPPDGPALHGNPDVPKRPPRPPRKPER